MQEFRNKVEGDQRDLEKLLKQKEDDVYVLHLAIRMGTYSLRWLVYMQISSISVTSLQELPKPSKNHQQTPEARSRTEVIQETLQQPLQPRHHILTSNTPHE